MARVAEQKAGVSGMPHRLFVVRKNVERNEIVVSSVSRGVVWSLYPLARADAADLHRVLQRGHALARGGRARTRAALRTALPRRLTRLQQFWPLYGD